MDTGDSFGSWLKQTRRARDLTREALAERVGCAVATLAKIEQGTRRPSRELALLLLDALQPAPAEREAAWRLARAPLAAPGDPAPATAEHVRRAAAPLPTPTAPLIGRLAEREEIARRLEGDDCRLLTLVGPGGIGKTRLALQAAGDAAPRFADGVVWVDLAPLHATEQIAPAIAEAAGLALPADRSPEAGLRAALCEQALLLVLDNFEHLADGAPLLAELLRQAPALKLLVTSRERLRLDGEWLFDVRGLAVPAAERPAVPLPPAAPGARPNPIERADSVLLFLERARRSAPAFALTPANREAVARICRLLEGMPLGIELAAGWTRVLSADEIADELTRGLDFLSATGRDTPARHRSMRAVFEHSWQRLEPDEQRALAALSVFRGGCDRAAASEVAGAPLPLLAALVDHSLVRAEQDAAGASRYTLHELVRQYAAAHLAADPASERAARERHSAYFATLLRQRLPELFSAGQTAAYAALHADLDNIRQAWAWAVAQRDTAALERMALALQSIYEDRGLLTEGAQCFGAAAEALSAAVLAAPQERRTLGDMIGRHGYFLARSGQFPAARARLFASLDLLRPGGPSVELADTLMNLGFVAYQCGAYEEARSWLGESTTILAAWNEPFFHGLSLCFAGMNALARGAAGEARATLEAALGLFRATGQPRGLAIALAYLGRAALLAGRRVDARTLLREGLAVASRARDAWGVGLALHHLGTLGLAGGDPGEAAYLQREAAEIFAALGERYGLGLALTGLADAALAAGDTPAARRALTDALTLALERGLPPIGLHAVLGAATLAIDEGRAGWAHTALRRVARHPAADADLRHRALRLAATLAEPGEEPPQTDTTLDETLRDALAALSTERSGERNE